MEEYMSHARADVVYEIVPIAILHVHVIAARADCFRISSNIML